MTYFVEFYDPAGNHIGTRTLLSGLQADAIQEAQSLLGKTPDGHKTTIRLFRQAVMENVTEIATFSR